MRAYDFNGTIYRGNCVREFTLFCLLRQPGLVRFLPGQLWAAVSYWFGAITETTFWARFYAYLGGLKNFEETLAAFWTQARLQKLRPLYLAGKSPRDLVLTTSAECLLRPACLSLGLPLIGSVVVPETGAVLGRACSGEEKLRRFRAAYPQGVLESFWSARLSDGAVAMEAGERRIVRGRKTIDWETYEAKEPMLRKWLRACISPEFFRFWCVGWVNLAAAWCLEAGFTLVLPPNIAFTVGYLLSLLVSFFMNSKVTFKVPMTLGRLGPFLLGYIPNFIVQSLTVLLFHNGLGLSPFLAYLIAAVVGTPVTFLTLKLLVFDRKKKGE